MRSHDEDVALALTRDSMQRAVWQRSVRSREALAGGGVALAALGAGVAVGGPISYALAGAAALAGFGGWAFSFFARRLEHVRCHVEEIHARRERLRLEELGRIRATLWDLAQAGEGADHAARGLEQFQRVHSRQETFTQLLAKKLEVGELTYGRYVGAVDEAYGAIIANLSAVVDRLRSARGSDAELLRERLRSLEQSGDGGAGVLRERLELRKGLFDEVAARLAQNETAIAALEHTTARVARMADLERPRAPEVDRVIRDLEDLAELASLFGSEKTEPSA
ncbi:MAG: hypothetical protein QNK04_16455 [Myxococcota bacterium]|nr:hypothetical protein [Myxococcota bacterium]